MVTVFCIGDVVGSAGCEFLRERLPSLKKLKGIDLVIANGENSADGNGITPASAQFLFDSGVDVITSGNHVFRRKEIYDLLESDNGLIRPANFPDEAPGNGVYIADLGRVRIAVMNILGVVYMENMESPFDTLDRLLESNELPPLRFVDLHAEATGEKKAMAYWANGRVTALFGTHTHVQTADECVLSGGTGYISDLGMTGPEDSVLGVKPELVIRKLRTKLPVRFDNAEPPCRLDGALFTADEKTGRCVSAERISLR